MVRIFSAFRRTAIAGALILGSATSLQATETLDAKLGRMAYAALQADEDLAELNLGVRALQGGTIVLWGPSPSAELTKKAEAILKKLPGVVTVKIECDRDAIIDPLVQKVEADVRKAPPEEAKSQSPVPITPPPVPAVVTRQVTTVEKPNANGRTKPPATTLLEPSETSTEAIERIRNSDQRFAKLIVEERQGRIVISGTVLDPTDAWTFAKKITPYVGDKNIVVSSVKR
jgi:hypothetical protein